MTQQATVNYKGRRVQATPPADGIRMKAAIEKYRVASETVWKLVESGELSAGLAPDGHLLISESGLESLSQKSTRFMKGIEGAAPPGGLPVNEVARELGIEDVTLRTWCRWDVHPGLGRRLASGIGPYTIAVSDGRRREWRGLLVSRDDAARCVEAMRHPLNREYPGNPGTWIADGIFRHTDGRLFFIESYVHKNRQRFGMTHRSLCVPVYKKRLDSLIVTYPGQRGSHTPWKLTVHSEESLDRLKGRREGIADGGHWLTKGELWSDREGLWYSSKFIAKLTGTPAGRMSDVLRKSGLTSRFKAVPSASKNGGRSAVVHHESEVRPLLGIGGGVPDTAKPKVRGRPAGSKSDDVGKRTRDMLAAWDRGEYGGNKAAAARAFGFQRSNASNIIAEHERKRKAYK